MKSYFRRRAEEVRGQVLILMALLMTTLIIFFGMVVNMGHLVQAKINLQNAVDLAAMSGASWQARFLNHVALINYRMRQSYKFVLFDIYVTNSRFNKGFIQKVIDRPDGTIGPFDRVPDPFRGDLSLGICQTVPGYEPSTPEELRVGGPGSITTNYCRLIDRNTHFFSALVQAPMIPIPIGIAMAAAQNQGNATLQENCNASSGQNAAYLDYVVNRLILRNKFQMSEMAKILQTFSQAFSTGSAEEPVQANSSKVGDQTIWQTFTSNLITANSDGLDENSLVYLNPPETRAFKDDSFTADPEVLTREAEPGGNFTKYFERQLVGFSLSVVESHWTGAGCNFSVIPRTVKDPTNPAKDAFVFLGLSRAREDSRTLPGSSYPALKIPFQIVLKATVKPHLLFWPRELTPTLVAVGAAKPFGSRVAPPIQQVNFEVSGTPQKMASGHPANLSFYPGDVDDGTGAFPGVGHIRILKDLDRALRIPANDSGVYRVTSNHTGHIAYERPSVWDSSFNVQGADTCTSQPLPFLCRALAPTLYEGLLWTVFPDPPQALAHNPSQEAEYPVEYSMPIGSTQGRPDIAAALRLMSGYYKLEDRQPPTADSSRFSLWHLSTLIPKEDMGIYSNDGKPFFYGNETSVASAFNTDWDPNSMDNNLAGATDGRRGYQIRLISLEQACDEVGASTAISLGGELLEDCQSTSSRVLQ